MRVFAIGDIHGCSRALDTLLAAFQPRPEDLLVALGDYVDRGPDSHGVLDRLIKLHATGRLVALRGNHDQMMLDARHNPRKLADWLVEGGRQALASYSALHEAEWFAAVPQAHWDFLEESLVNWFEIDTHFFVHANAYPDVPLNEQPEYMLMWEPLTCAAPHDSGKIMVCGHTSQKSGKPLNLGHAICIDTYAHGSGWLTCLDVISGRVWQANQKGEQHQSWIGDYA
jgi:serine/threonine protein phosphatase 1